MNLAKRVERELQREEERIRLESFRTARRDECVTSRAAAKLLESTEPKTDAPSAVAVETPVEPDPNTVELTGDFSQIVAEYHREKYGDMDGSIRGHWYRRRRAQVGLAADVDLEELQFSITVTSYDANGAELQVINDYLVAPDFRIEPGTRIKRGVIGELNVSEKTTGVFVGFFHFDESGKLDLVNARAASDEEVAKIFTPPIVEAPALPVPRVFQRIKREAGDATSFLGFRLGTVDEEIKLPLLAGWHAFHLPYAAILGSVEAPVDWEFPESDTIRLQIHDAFGKIVLDTILRAASRNGLMRAEFDSVRLEPGDFLLTWNGCGGRRAKGSVNGPHVGLFPRGIPKGPILLDALVREHEVPTDPLTMQPIPAGMSQFRFMAD